MASADASTTEAFQDVCGVTELVFTAADTPSELIAVIEKEYLLPFFKFLITAGLSVTVTESPLCKFLIW
ncbi:unannotated protein [freshwater metagenome]|uniref:Unannotated protein n=1 Tax=freshwater metagenome TaxID=449393 RepID=A0A6J6LIP2_9ZZZZ